jgi:hypothetical protein
MIVAVGLLAAIGLCGIVLDIGHVCVARSELQRSADAGALAAVSVMQDIFDLNETPVPYYVSDQARSEATKYVGANPCRGKTLILPRNDSNNISGDLIFGHYASASRSFNPHDTNYNAAEVLVRRDAIQNGRLPLFFGPLFGLPSVDVNASAAAYIETDISGFHIDGGDDAACQLLPFALHIGLWNDRIIERVDHYTHDPVNKTVSNGSDGIYEIKLYPSKLSPGNFGTVDIGASNDSTADLSRQILHGPNASDLAHFPDSTIKLGDDGTLHLNGDTGISAGCKDELAAIEGQPRIIPLFSTMSGNGNNADFTIVAFVGVTILDSRLTGSMNMKHVTIQPCFTVDGTAIGGGDDGVTSRFIRTPPRLRRNQLIGIRSTNADGA